MGLVCVPAKLISYKLVRFYSAIINLTQTMKWNIICCSRFYQLVVAFNSVPLNIFVVDNYSIQIRPIKLNSVLLSTKNLQLELD